MQIVKDAHLAVEGIASGARVFIHGGAATPTSLVDALVDRHASLTDVELIHLHTHGEARYADPQFARAFRVANLFVGENMRGRLSERVDYLPCFLSEIPALFRSRKRPLDVALVQLSPPDRHGFCTLGPSVDVARAAVDVATVVIGEINPHMPRVHGDGHIHVNDIDIAVEVDRPLPEAELPVLGDEEIRIGRLVSGLVEDGATLQMGIGTIPDAVLAALSDHRHLGIHTEMWSTGALPLLQSGAVDNSRKKVHPGKTVSGFVVGTRAVFDHIDDNPDTVFLDIGYVNNPTVIARNPRVTAINSCVEIDLTGQVCADSIGTRIISGIGGQMDFMRGASLSEGGKPIMALTARTKKGHARIVPTLKSGAGVVTTRGHIHTVVTEYGAADLYGKTLGERAKMLIELAHPDDRETLAREWHDRVS